MAQQLRAALGRGPNRRGVAVPAAVAAVAVAAAVLVAAADQGGPAGPAVTIRAPDGALLVRVPLTGDTFAVGYRNSVYRTLAEERYQVQPDGRFQVVQLAAEQVAVLEEYYAVPSRPRRAPAGDRLDYVAPPDPARPAVFDLLHIAATDLGRRTLFVPGHAPVALWRLVDEDEDPTVVMEIEESS